MRTDRFRIAGQVVEIQRAAEPGRGGPMPAAGTGRFGSGRLGPPAMRAKRETAWHILVGRQRIGVAHRLPNGLYSCGRYAEHDLRTLACRLMGADADAVEDAPAP